MFAQEDDSDSDQTSEANKRIDLQRNVEWRRKSFSSRT